MTDPTQPGPEGSPEALYQLLQELRSAERHELSQKGGDPLVAYEESAVKTVGRVSSTLGGQPSQVVRREKVTRQMPASERLSAVRALFEKHLRSLVEEKPDLLDVPPDVEQQLAEEKNRLEAILAAYPPSARENMRQQSTLRLNTFLREYRGLVSLLHLSDTELRPVRQIVATSIRDGKVLRSDVTSELEMLEHAAYDAERLLYENVPLKSPEAFLAQALLHLRQYRRQLQSGIAEVPYAREKMRTAVAHLSQGQPVALVGETGTGKTVVAMEAARRFSENGFELVPGHAFMTKEDLFSYVGLQARQVPPEEVPATVQRVTEKYLNEHPELQEKGDAEEQRIRTMLESVIRGQAEQPRLQTEEILGVAERCAQEGKVLILDEYDYIPPGLLAGLNALMEGRGIKPKPGFGIIFTGNQRPADVMKQRYKNRNEPDAAFLSRLNSGLIEYQCLPQADSASFQEGMVTAEQYAQGEAPANRELYQIGLALLIDQKGNLAAPPDACEQLWNLCQAVGLFQKAYAGLPLDHDVRVEGGAQLALRKYPVSNRTFRAIVQQWRLENYRYPLDWYIYDHLIRPASTLYPSEAWQMWSICKHKYGFFGGSQPDVGHPWSVLQSQDVASGVPRIAGMGAVGTQGTRFKEQLRQGGQRNVFHQPQELAEAYYGVRMPSFTDILQESGSTTPRLTEEQERQYLEVRSKLEAFQKTLDEWQESIAKFCADEAAILGDTPAAP